MLHSDGRASHCWKHRIVTLLTSKLNRALADVSAGVPTHRQIALRPHYYEPDGAPGQLVTIPEQKAFRYSS